MHPKRGKLFNRFLPANLESMGRTLPAELCRTNDERMASASKDSADPLQPFSHVARQISAVVGRPVVDHVIRASSDPIVVPLV